MYWMSTKSKMEFRRPSYCTPQLDALLRGSVGVDIALIALDAKLSPLHVRSYQQQLRLRPMTSHLTKRK